jgi:Ca-activated chloride channel family protein
MIKQQDFYELFGLARNATGEDIRQAYFEAARRLHPDKNLAPGETELFLGVQEAYEVLSNPKKRAKYDSTLPPEVIPESPLDLKIFYSRKSLLRLDEPQLIYTIAELSVPTSLGVPPSPPLNLCLVLDCSTSMQGPNMDVVKATAIQIMQKLKPQDIFSIIAFSDRAEVIIPATRGIDLAKQESRIQMLQTSGGTEIFSGLSMGYNEILRNVARAQINHIILLTDGRTYGDEQQCLDLAQQASEQSIGISGLGIGSEWNDTFLDNLTSITGGNSMYVPRPQDIQRVLLDKFTRLGRAYSEETRLEFKTPEGIELRYIFRLLPDSGLLSYESPVSMGSLILDTSLRILLEFVVQPEIVQKENVILLDGKIFASLADRSVPARPIPITLSCTVTDEANSDPPPAEIVDALSKLKLYRLQEQARIDVSAGNFEQAAAHLSRLATHLLAQGERGLARTALMEAENIQRKKSFSQQGGKEIKYGTRALLTSGRREENQ